MRRGPGRGRAGGGRARAGWPGRPTAPRARSPACFCIAMGKHGAFELNYSSDIDVSVFYDPDALPLAEGVETAGVRACA